jgi:hypothetical protein
MPPASAMNVVNAVNLILGLLGLVIISGLLLTMRWGHWGTVTVSVFAIMFDGVTAASVTLAAFAALILPVVFLMVPIPRRGNCFSLHPKRE